MQVRWLRAALSDLDAAAEYIAKDNPVAARRMVRHLLGSIERLADQPAMGRAGRVLGTRELVIPPYIIPYRGRGTAIEILRVFHGAQKRPDEL